MGYDITLGLLSKKTSNDLVQRILDNVSSPPEYSDAKQSKFVTSKIQDVKKCISNHEDFAHCSGYSLAMILQSLDQSWYLRGNWYSGIFDEEPMEQLLRSKNRTKQTYLSSWTEILPQEFNSGENSGLQGNYSVGAISSPEKMKLFILDYKNDHAFRQLINNYLEDNIYPLLDAVLTAIKQEKFLFEAEALIEPSLSFANPPTSLYSLDKCNPMGAKLFYYVFQYGISSLNNNLEEAKNSEIEFQKTVEDYYNLLNKEYGNLIPKFTTEEGFKTGLSHYIQKNPPSDTLNSDLKAVGINIAEPTKKKYFYRPIIAYSPKAKPFDFWKNSRWNINHYASRVMPGQTLKEAVSNDLGKDFNFNGEFDLEPIGLEEGKDSLGNILPRIVVRVIVR